MGGFRTPPGTSSPDPAAPKGRALSPDLLLRGPLRGTTLRQHCLKCRFLSPAQRDLLLSLFTSLSSDCGPLRWGLCPRIRSSWMSAGGRLREDADRRQAQGQGEKPHGQGARLPPVEGAVDLQTTWPPAARPPDPKEGISEGSRGGPHLGVQNSANCILLIKQFYRLSALSLLVFLFHPLCHWPRLSPLTRGQQRQKGRSQNQSSKRGLWTSPLPDPTGSTPLSSSQPGNSPGEVKGCVPALGSQVLGAEIRPIAV